MTRPRAQSAGLSESLSRAGASVFELPLIETAAPSDDGAGLTRALSELDSYEWVVFTSANAVEVCWRGLVATPITRRPKVAAVGAATAAALSARGVDVALVPGRFVAESLVESFPPPGPPGLGAVLLPCAVGARDVLAEGLRAKGWRTHVVEAYSTVMATPAKEALERLVEADVVTFMSSSAVTSFLELPALERLSAAIACIGPVTARTAAQAGMHVDVIATEHTAEGLVAALVEWIRAGRPRRQ